jgi:polyphosphate kinase
VSPAASRARGSRTPTDSVETEQPIPLTPDSEAASVQSTASRPDLAPDTRYLNRELSWLDFNERVLALAERRSLPLLERTKFLAICSSNLDEFFQVRVGGLKVQLEVRVAVRGASEDRPRQRLQAIRERVRSLIAKRAEVFRAHVAELAHAGIRLSEWDELDNEDRAFLEQTFEERILPVLTPLAVDPAHPFPYISNLSLNLAVVVRTPGELTRRIARVKVPPFLPRFIATQDGTRFVPVEQLISQQLATLFPGMEIVECTPFRVTRNTDYDIELDGADDMVAAVESVLLRRRRSPIVVRLEVGASMSEETVSLLRRELRLEPDDVYRLDVPLALSGLWSLVALDRPELKLEPWTPVTQARLMPAKDSGPADLFDVIREGDVLVQHPYDSFETSVEAFIEQAARDPSVLAIKQTLYRTSADESSIMESLIRAAGEEKQVVCVLELKARFDEETNIVWAQRLEDAGVHVTYGVVGLKTHAKLSLVVRDEPDGLRRYTHIGTGNYNPETARIYEDVGLFTADPELTADVADVFHLLTGYSRQHDFGALLVAPADMRPGLLELIREQAHPDGRIAMKLNSLVDAELIDSLYEASQAGARVDLIVRSICCLRPAVPGLSETIRVRSIVGRHLEHSRLFRFGRDGDATYFLGSADLMDRNLDRRVEVLSPVRAPGLKAQLDEILETLEADDALAWELDPDGRWHRVSRNGTLNAQAELEHDALERARRITAI